MSHRNVLYLVALTALAGCAGSEISQTPSEATPAAGRPQAASQVPNPYCSPVTVTGINAEINTLYRSSGMDERDDALEDFQAVQRQLDLGSIDGARTKTKALVAEINHEFSKLSATRQATYLAAKNQLISDLWCFVGISGQVFDLNPGDPVKTFDVPAVGGVQFPANVVPVGTLVSITDLTAGGACPLFTVLDCFPGYLSISTYPATTLTQPATVVLCPPSTAPPGLVVAHQDPTIGFEILNPVPVPAALATTCANTAQAPTGPAAWFAGLLREATSALLPKRAEAAPVMFGVGGIGGTTIRFSPFAAVGTTLTATGGTGGTATKFAPPSGSKAAAPSKNAAPNAAPPNNPPLPSYYIQGGVGSKTFTGLPSVTVQTQGGDPDGVNKVPGVTVTFTTAASQLYDLDSDAKVCDAQGNIPANGQVTVVTDANGVATLPCLAFGNVAGYANLSATFDPTTLNFPNVALLTVQAQDGNNTSSSLNWLVKSAPGVPTQLAFVQAPSAAAGAGVAFGQQPSLQLKDALGNEVYSAGTTIDVTVTNGGGTAAFTAPVTTDANGLAVFSDLSIGGKVAGVDQTLSFSFAGITQPLTATVQMTPGVASQLVVTRAPSSSAQAGVPLTVQPEVTIEDKYGNVVSSNNAVQVALASGSPTLAGTLSVNAVNGVATFTDLQINGATGPRTLSFTSFGPIASDPTGVINVTPGPAAQIVITQQPSGSAPAGQPLPVQPIVTVQDQFGNPIDAPATVTAVLNAIGNQTLVGTTTVPTVNGVATFLDLQINGTTGGSTLYFTSGNLTSPPTTNPVVVTPGAVAAIQTYIGGVSAPTYNYGTNLTPNTAVAPAPQVRVTDTFGNPVAGQTIYWSATTANGGVLTQGATGSPTNAQGVAQVSAWQIGFGLNTAVAGLSPTSGTSTIPDAIFTATSQLTGSIFSCAVPPSGPNSKGDVGNMSIKAPNGIFRKVTLRMSITGTARSYSDYDATLEARLNSPTGTLLGTARGELELPGNNGNPVPVTFYFPTPIAKQSGSATIFFVMRHNAPATRKPQIWYLSSTFKPSDPCYGSLLYAPGSTTTFSRGLSIDVIN